ncbi:hypothetical protein ARMGADRAFT_1091897 [Armillaria gallica]|uniref:Uncharacterized protein n=1 Tax=Armillaria gallica TaxID=47427 RepID=A0A2H3CXD3_ARMGA|nr:hypothetical protein ARMGADRAFT_1091897 [Armillaria gallica]
MASLFRQRNLSRKASPRCLGRLSFAMRRCIFTWGATSLVIKATDIVDDLPAEIPSKHFRVSNGMHVLAFLVPFQYAPCDDLFLLILHKDDMSSKRRDVVALDDDGKREHLERDVACRKREVGPLSLLLIVRGIPADPDLFPINATTYRHLASSQGWLEVAYLHPAMAQTWGSGRRYSRRSIVSCARGLVRITLHDSLLKKATSSTKNSPRRCFKYDFVTCGSQDLN